MSKVINIQEKSLPYHAVGEKFSIAGRELGQEDEVLVEVVKSDDCYECVFEKDMMCLRRTSIHGCCHSIFRKDLQNVKFVPVGEQQDNDEPKMNAKEV